MKSKVQRLNYKPLAPTTKYVNAGLLLLVLFFVFFETTASDENSVSVSKKYKNQLLIQPSMVLCESNNEIATFADILVDEQSCTPGSGWNPCSACWTPGNSSEASVYIDFGQVIHLSQIALHILAETEGLELSTGTPDNWQYLTTLSSYDTEGWWSFELSAETQFLKIKAPNPENSFVNELQVFGFPADQLMEEKSGIVPDFIEKFPGDFSVNKNDIFVKETFTGNQLYISIPEDLSHNFTIEVYNLNGVKLTQKEFVYNISTRVLVDITDSCDRCGVYILCYHNNTGIHKTLKFQKKR